MAKQRERKDSHSKRKIEHDKAKGKQYRVQKNNGNGNSFSKICRQVQTHCLYPNANPTSTSIIILLHQQRHPGIAPETPRASQKRSNQEHIAQSQPL